MIDFKDQTELFKLIGGELRKKTEAIVLGGSAMMFYGAKASTKDVDLVFTDKDAKERVEAALVRMGFKESKKFEIFRHYKTARNVPMMLEGKNTRFDLFLNEVVTTKLTDTVLSRLKEEHQFENLTIKVISPEDIILFKCATERDKDLIDGAELARKFKIDWNIIIEESIKQTEVGELVVPVFLLDFLWVLRDEHKIDIPKDVIKKLEDISEKALARLVKQQKAVDLAEKEAHKH